MRDDIIPWNRGKRKGRMERDGEDAVRLPDARRSAKEVLENGGTV